MDVTSIHWYMHRYTAGITADQHTWYMDMTKEFSTFVFESKKIKSLALLSPIIKLCTTLFQVEFRLNTQKSIFVNKRKRDSIFWDTNMFLLY